MKRSVRKRETGKRQSGEEEEETILLETENALIPLSPLSPNSRADALLEGVVFSCALSVYLYTAYPSLAGGDSGQLLASICTAGIPRAPGHPLFALAARLAIYVIPFGTPAWRVAVLCSFFGALAAHYVHKTVKLWTNKTMTGVLSGMMFAFSPIVWNYSIHANVFVLNNMLVAVMLYTTAHFAKHCSTNHRRATNYACLATFAGGLGLTNHNNIIFFVAPCLFWLYSTGKKFLWDNKVGFLKLGSSFTVGYLSNALLLLPIFKQGTASWNYLADFRTWLFHIARPDTPSFETLVDHFNTTMLGNLYRFYSTIAAQVLFVGIIILFVGIAASISAVLIRNRKNSFGVLLSVMFGIYLLALISSPAFPEHPLLLHKFFMQEHLVGCLFIGIGANFIIARFFGPAAQNAVVILGVIASCLQLGINFPHQNQHDNYVFHNYGHAILDPLPNNSILLLNGDLPQYVTEYFHYCEHVRPDITLVNLELASRGLIDETDNITIPGLFYSPVAQDSRAFNLKQFLEVNQNHQVYSVGPHIDDKSQFKGFTVIPFGMGLKYVSTSGSVPTPWEWEATLDSSLPATSILPNNTKDTQWEHFVVQHYWRSYEAKANMFIIVGSDPENENAEKSLWKAAEILEIVRLHFPQSRFTLRHLGYIYENLLDHHAGRPELYALMIRSWEQYLKLPKEQGDKKYDKIKIAVHEYKKKLIQEMRDI